MNCITPFEIAYLEHILQDSNILLIEIWDRVLYARMKKGCGRNRFISKKGIKFNINVYYRQSEFRNIVKQYHPDITEKSRQSAATELFKNINSFKEKSKSYLFKRSQDASSYIISLPEFTNFTSTKSNTERDSIRERIEEELDSSRFNNCAGFSTDGATGFWIQRMEEANDPETAALYEEFARTWAWAMSPDVQWEANKNNGWKNREEWDAFIREQEQAMDDLGW